MAGAYIWSSDTVLLALVRDPETLARISSIKGTAFVLVTGAALFAVLVVMFRRAERDAEAIRAGEAALAASERRALAGTLAGAIAHDFNNLIMPLQMGIDELQTLRRDADPTETRMLEAMSGACTRLHDLAHRLTRVGRERSDTFEPIDLVAAVRGALEVARAHPAFARKTIRVVAPDPVTLSTSAVLVDQVTINLLLNAAEAGASTMEVHVRQVGDEVELAVHDDGPGIEDAAQAFAPWSTTKATGSGLGLFSVAARAELHHGRAEAGRSDILGGAVVRMVVPAQ
ncbi:MAG: HAMP domain-containing histidine kinase [Alphaproteobacteria bacterium]|nr:HAMP domain-containing histidine kinase [Alphaproteobacteria bacterium]